MPSGCGRTPSGEGQQRHRAAPFASTDAGAIERPRGQLGSKPPWHPPREIPKNERPRRTRGLLLRRSRRSSHRRLPWGIDGPATSRNPSQLRRRGATGQRGGVHSSLGLDRMVGRRPGAGRSVRAVRSDSTAAPGPLVEDTRRCHQRDAGEAYHPVLSLPVGESPVRRPRPTTETMVRRRVRR